METSKKNVKKVKNVFQSIFTFFALISFIFVGIFTGLSLLSNLAYRRYLKGNTVKIKEKIQKKL
ncbi:MAG: hypothetical protein BGO41_03565 [Clostridiales bacterium 38-18]|nr:MAG: hypothetical protein BGO41_03565 [Clostridiales bacterium 38-18]